MPMLIERINRVLSEIGLSIMPQDRELELEPAQQYVRSERFSEAELLERCAEVPEGETWTTGNRVEDQPYSYTLLRYHFEVPEALQGQPLMFTLQTGTNHGWSKWSPWNLHPGWHPGNPQFVVVVNGRITAGMDEYHPYFVLTEDAEAGESFDILLMHYSAHEPVRMDVVARIAPVDEQVKNYYFDAKLPFDTVRLISENHQDHVDVIQVINESLNLVDMRVPGSEAFHRSIPDAHAYLREHLYERFGQVTKRPVLKLVGHTHIDIAWLWPLSMTEDKAVRSFATVLDLMDRYPEYIFMSSQPQLYAYIEQHAPQMFERIRARIDEGRWEVEGGMWIEADCNISSGEALARQFLYGKRYFRERFNKDNRILWLPDVFGYSAALPQIMKLSGIDYFMTTKISWNDTNKLPVDTFLWKGIDGSETLTHFSPPMNYHALADFFPNVSKGFTTYNSTLTAAQVLGTWQRYQQKDLNDEALALIGHGDGGGGTTMEMLENARRFQEGLPSAPRTEWSTSRAFFEQLEKDVEGKRELPTWEGELYLEFHRGTYTTQARNKRWNRQSEFSLQGTEKLRVLAKQLLQMPYPADRLHEAWIIALRNQFHDILPGSSIQEVYEDSDHEYADIFRFTRAASEDVLRQLYQQQGTLLLVNRQGFDRQEPVTTAGEILLNEEGQPYPAQRRFDGAILSLAPVVPAIGYSIAKVQSAEALPLFEPKDVQEPILENDQLKLIFSPEGQLTSFYDKRASREILQAGRTGNRLVLHEDKPIHYDAWDIADYYVEKAYPVAPARTLRLVEEGPIRSTLELTFEGEGYRITEFVHLYHDCVARVDLDFVVDWHVTDQLLKLYFPLDINGHEATYEIQYGHVKRQMHRNTSWDRARFEVANHKWIDVAEDNYGVTFINESKYGSSLLQGELGLTLLKSSKWPSPVADRETHHFSYSIRPHTGDWRDHDMVRQAYAFNDPLITFDGTEMVDHFRSYPELEAAAEARQRLPYTPAEGTASGVATHYSLLRAVDPNVIIETVKVADQDPDAIVVRLYEAFGRRARVSLESSIAWSTLTQVNLLEDAVDPEAQQATDLVMDEGRIWLNLKPFEIKTLMLR